MGGFSLMHWVVVAIVLVLVLGGGRFSSMMGDVAKGIKNFKKGMDEDDASHASTKPAARLQAQPPIEPAAPDAKLQPMKDDRPSA